jgi:hypothetical protein
MLRSLRMRALLSQEQLAQRSGLGVRTIRDMEVGRVACPRGNSVQLLSVALGLAGEARRAFELTSRMSQVGPPPPGPTAIEDGTPQLCASARIMSTGWAVPAQLPMDTAVFAGRERELAQLDALLESAAGGPAVVVAALLGGPGVGKTALAVHWAHRVGGHFPDGQLYVDLRGFDRDQPLSPSEAVGSLLGALGVPNVRVPRDLHAQAGLYRSLMHGRRVLVLLDNARDVEQVRPLLPGAPGSVVVVTSRHRLTGLIAVEGAHPVSVGLLPPREARELMARRLGRERVVAEPAAVNEIIDRCAHLPLALALFASRATTGPGFPLTTWAKELRDAPGALDAFNGDPISNLRTSFSLSYNALSTEAARLFRLFGCSPTTDLNPATAATMTNISERKARAAFDELTHAHLTTEHHLGRYQTHRLLRAYAAELDEPPGAGFREMSVLTR